MPKQKYDYKQLKIDYFQSDYEDVKGFMESIWRSYDWNCRKQTRGWGKEKQAYKDKILAKALEKNALKQANELEVPIDTLKKAKKKAIIKIINYLNKELNPSDMEKVVKMIKTELWEPTTYSKNENMNTEKIEWIHIVMWGNIDGWGDNEE